MAKIKRSYEMDMCSGPMAINILRFAIPLMISNILQLLFNAADVIVVSRFCGDEALAAVGSNGSLINLIIGLFTGLSVASNIVAARLLGERNFDRLHKVVHTSMLFAVVGGVFLTVFGVVFARQALLLMKVPDEVIDLSTLYLRIYFLGAPASLVYNFGSSLLRSKGDTKRPLYIITLAGVINVILNLILVAVFDMSVDGVAIATVVSQYISAILITLCLMSDNDHLHLYIKELKLHKNVFLELLRIGLPAGAQGMVFSLSNIVVQSSVNSFGKDTMAAFSATNNIQGFLFVIVVAFYQSNMTFTSQNLGAGHWNRIKRSLGLNLMFSIIIASICGVLTYVFATPLLHIYTSDASVVEIGIEIMKYICLPVVLCNIMDTTNGSLRGLGYSFLAMIFSIIGACMLRVGWIMTVFKAYRTIPSLFIVYPISWTFTALVYFAFLAIISPKCKKRLELKETSNS